MWPNTDDVGMSVVTVQVDSTGYEIWEGDSLKVWYVSYSGYEAYWDVRYLEKVGSPCFFTPVASNFDRPICGLRCFETPPATDYIFVDYPCDTVINSIFSSSQYPTISEHIKFYPNPASGQVTLEYPFQNGEILQIELYDLTGKQVRSERFDNNVTYTFDTSGLPDGIYSLRLLHNGWVLKNMKLIIIE
jgi:hypothetical protein